MKIINIPSVAAEKCNVNLKFSKKNGDSEPWHVELECTTPSFQAKINAALYDIDVNSFINNLKDIESNRKGQSQLADEWSFSLTIRSIDSLGHFAVDISIWSQGKDSTDTMSVCFEIEPSLLTKLLSEFNTLGKLV